MIIFVLAIAIDELDPDVRFIHINTDKEEWTEEEVEEMKEEMKGFIKAVKARYKGKQKSLH